MKGKKESAKGVIGQMGVCMEKTYPGRPPGAGARKHGGPLQAGGASRTPHVLHSDYLWDSSP